MDKDVIVLENSGRDVLVFPVVDNAKGKRPKVVKHVVIGDANDRVPYIEGARDPALQPDPVVRMTEAELKELGSANLRVLKHYVDSGVVRAIAGRDVLERVLAA